MHSFQPRDPDFEQRVRASFERQRFMRVAVLSVEFKINLLAPAAGAQFRATGRVLRPGRTLTVCAGEIVAMDGETCGAPIAVMQATMMAVEGRDLAD